MSSINPIAPIGSNPTTLKDPNKPLTSAEQLAANIDAIHQSGNGNTDINAQVALALGAPNTDTSVSLVQKINQVVKTNQTAIESFYNDPQQSRIPTGTTQAAHAMVSIFGKNVFTEDHVLQIQKDMISAGYMPKDSIANGTWDPVWNAAFLKATAAKQTAPTVGNAPAKSTVQHILGALSFSRAANVLVEMVKSTPRQVAQMVGDSVATGGGVFNKINGTTFGYLKIPGTDINIQEYLTKKITDEALKKAFNVKDPEKARIMAGQAIAELGAKSENRSTLEDFTKKSASTQQQIQDLLTLMSFLPAGKLALGVKGAVEVGTKGAVLGAEEVIPKYTLLNSIVTSAKTGEVGLLQPAAKAFINQPGLNMIYKGAAQAIAKTAPMQIAIRNTLAQRLRLPAVRALNQASMSTLGYSLKEQALGVAASKTGGKNNSMDMTLYGKAPITGPLATALDIFSMQMNPGGAARMGTKEILGDVTKSADALRNAFGDTGALVAWQRANPEQDYGALLSSHLANGGKETDILKFIGQQVNKIALEHAVDIEKNALINDGTWAKMTMDDHFKWNQDTAHAIWQEAAARKPNEPASRLDLSRNSILVDQNAMETGFRNIRAEIMLDTRLKNPVGYTPEEVNLLKEYATRPMLFSGNSSNNISNINSLSKILGKSTIDSGTYYRGLSEKDMAEIVGRQENWQPYWSKGGKTSPTQPAPWNHLVENTPEGGLKQGNVWDSGVHKSVTSDLEGALKIAQEGGTGGGMTGAVAKIEINNPVNGIASLNKIAPMTNRTNEALIAPSKLVLKKINKGKYIRTRDNGVKDIVDEYVFGIADDNFVNKIPEVKGAKPSTLPQMLKANSIMESMIHENAHFFTPEYFQNTQLGEGLDLSHIPQKNTKGNGAGAIGLARNDTLTFQPGMDIFNGLEEQLSKARTATEVEMVKTNIGKVLLQEFGINPLKQLSGLDARDYLNLLEKKVHTLPGDLSLAKTASATDRARVAELSKLGYKPIYGTDIGHVFTPGVQYTDLGSADIKAIGKVASSLGLSPAKADAAAVSARLQVEKTIELQKTMNSGKYIFPVGMNATDIQTLLREGLVNNAKLTPGQRLTLGFANSELKFVKRDNFRIPIDKIMAEHVNEPQFTREDAWNLIKKAKAQEASLRETSPKVLRDILTQPVPEDVASLMGVEAGSPLMSQEAANAAIRAIWRANIKVPSTMIGGIAKLEDILTSGWGVGGKGLVNKTLMDIASIPVQLQNLRSRVRYQESILFAYRRMAKTMLKGTTENIPPTMYPEYKLQDMGIDKEAEALHKRIFPQDAVKTAFLDDAERLVKEADFYNLYSPREFEKWGAYWLNKQGFTDAEIAKKLENVMGYGERTAAERSLNAVFFPFSFNKTVMRQFGQVLVTSPGKVMVAKQIINLYDQLHGPDVLAWLEKNMPVIKEVEKLNALSHGVGLGQFGGINAPYITPAFNAIWTLFSPKKIDYGTTAQNTDTLKLLKQYIPMIKEFSDLFLNANDNKPGGQVFDTLKTITRITDLGRKETLLNPYPRTKMPYQAQQDDAWAYRAELIVGLSDYLKHNYQNPNDKIVFPEGYVPVGSGLTGKPISKATIGELVHYKYPLWDNTKSGVVAAQKATEADRFIGETSKRDKVLAENYRGFDTYSQQLNSAISKDNIDDAALADITDQMRKIALQLVKDDPNFYDFYKTHYQRLYGPLEAFK